MVLLAWVKYNKKERPTMNSGHKWLIVVGNGRLWGCSCVGLGGVWDVGRGCLFLMREAGGIRPFLPLQPNPSCIVNCQK